MDTKLRHGGGTSRKRMHYAADITGDRVAPAIIPDYTEEQVRERQLTSNYVGNVR